MAGRASKKKYQPIAAHYDYFSPEVDHETMCLLSHTMDSCKMASNLWVSTPLVEEMGECLSKNAVTVSLKAFGQRKRVEERYPSVKFVNVAHTTNPWLFEAYQGYTPKTEWCLPFPGSTSAYLTRLAMKRQLSSRIWVTPTFCDLNGLHQGSTTIAVKINNSLHRYLNAEDTEDPALVEHFVKHPQRPVLLTSFQYITGDAADKFVERAVKVEQDRLPASNVWAAYPLRRNQRNKVFQALRPEEAASSCFVPMPPKQPFITMLTEESNCNLRAMAVENLLLVNRKGEHLSRSDKELALAKLQFLLNGCRFDRKNVIGVPVSGETKAEYLFTKNKEHYHVLISKEARDACFHMLKERRLM